MPDLERDKAEILDVIHRNRICVWTRNYEGYADCFVHAPYTARWNASTASGIFVRQGWDSIGPRVKHQMEVDPSFYNTRAAYETTVIDLNVRVSGDMAWATYRQVYPDVPDHHAGSSPSHELRILERHEGKWRIAFLGFLDADGGPPKAALLRLDEKGTVLSQTSAAAAALAADEDLIVRAGRLHIRNSRADQRLQAGIRWAASLNSAHLPGSGSLPIVLESGAGLPAKVWWVIADSGRVLFSLTDPGLDARRLDAAAIVYGLSPAQRTLAGHIAEGLTLAEIAERMQITPNTARTHLNRVFDKTGVRTQPALVRVLLTAISPV